jgi:FixJ family two-component response regulator
VVLIKAAFCAKVRKFRVPQESEFSGAGFDQTQCHVLIVDDDVDCLDEYRELAERLGYPCLSAEDGGTALRMISEDRRIGILVIDIRMPGMDGLTLLDELSERFMPTRPLVAIVVTGESSIEKAVHAMRSSAVDYLEKPVSVEGLALALRRAASKWARLAAQFRLLMAKENLPKVQTDIDPAQPSMEVLQDFASALLKARQSRSKYFDPGILSGPAWGILMDLTAAGLKGDQVPTSSACISAEVPFSTALRHVNQLVAAGLVKRELDPTDKRRTMLSLEPEALKLMTKYLASSWKSLAPKMI